jgi:hypothetical protein
MHWCIQREIQVYTFLCQYGLQPHPKKLPGLAKVRHYFFKLQQSHALKL